jgi:putative ABC transport system permease protein
MNPEILFVYLGFSVLIGFLSGSYPAFIISSFHPIQILKGRLKIGSKGSVVFRDSLVVVQFVISIILIICTLVIHNQLSFIRNRDLGFDKDQIITIYTMDRNIEQNSEIFKKELMDHPEIVEVSASLDLPSTVKRTSSVRWSEQGEERELSINYTYVDYDFFNVYDIEIVEGRSFSEDFLTDEEQAILLNEAAVRDLGWENPVGRQLTFQGRERTVVGVIKDFHFHSLHREIDPLVFGYHQNWQIDFFSVKINPANIPRTLSYIEEKWKEFSPEFPFQYAFLDERIDRIYKAEQKLGQSFNIFTFVALSIACLGLIGLASFISEQKKKEISIRKILGADLKSILALTATEYVKCIAVAAVVAWPTGYLIMDRWLQNFAYRTSMRIGIFILSGLLAFVIALITVSYQSIKAAVANPVDSLRYE